MVTMVTEERKPLFGKVVGRSEAVEPAADAPHIELSTLGQAIEHIWLTMGNYHPEVKVIALQMMPDHLHVILHVTRPMEKTFNTVVRSFWQGAKKVGRSFSFESESNSEERGIVGKPALDAGAIQIRKKALDVGKKKKIANLFAYIKKKL